MTVHVISMLCYLIFRYVVVFLWKVVYIYLEEKYDKYEKINIKSTVSGEKRRKHIRAIKKGLIVKEKEKEPSEAYVAVAVLVTFYL